MCDRDSVHTVRLHPWARRALAPRS